MCVMCPIRNFYVGRLRNSLNGLNILQIHMYICTTLNEQRYLLGCDVIRYQRPGETYSTHHPCYNPEYIFTVTAVIAYNLSQYL